MKLDLTQGPIVSTLARLMLPMSWGIFSIIGFNLADAYFVGKLGADELAAISFTFPIVMIFGSIAMGMSVGASSVIARAIGEGDERKVKRYTTDALVLSVVIVFISIAVGFFTIDPIFRALGADENVLPLIKEYMQIWYAGMIFLVVPMVGNGAIRAQGDTVSAALIMTVAGITNLVLDPILIFGLFSFPAMGLKGAALATVIARATTLLASLKIIHFKYKMIDFSIPKFADGFASWKEVMRIGLPAAGTNAINPITLSAVYALVSRYGPNAVAAFGIVAKLESFLMIIVMGLSSSIGPFVGQNFGAKKFDRIDKATKWSAFFSIGWGSLITVFLFLFGRNLVSLFNDNPEVINFADLQFKIIALSFGFEGVRNIAASTFNALGEPKTPTVLMFCKMLVIYLPLANLLVNLWGLEGIFISQLVANLVIGLVAMNLMRKMCIQCREGYL